MNDKVNDPFWLLFYKKENHENWINEEDFYLCKIAKIAIIIDTILLKWRFKLSRRNWRMISIIKLK